MWQQWYIYTHNVSGILVQITTSLAVVKMAGITRLMTDKECWSCVILSQEGQSFAEIL